MKRLHPLLFSSPIGRLAYLGRFILIYLVCGLPIVFAYRHYHDLYSHLMVLGRSAFPDPDAVIAEVTFRQYEFAVVAVIAGLAAVCYSAFYSIIPRLRSIGLSPLLVFVPFILSAVHLTPLVVCVHLFLVLCPPDAFRKNSRPA